MYNEYSAAQWVALRLRNKVTFSRQLGEWLCYERGWKTAAPRDVLKLIAQEFEAKIGEIRASHSDNAADLIKVYNGYLSKQRLDNVMSLSLLALEDLEQWDNCPILFPAANCLVNLETGVCTNYTPADRISRHSSVAYYESARAPRWEQFMAEVCNNDQAKISYLQRAAGYTLTGLLNEQVLFVLFGPGANGKNIFLETLYEVIGPLTLAYQTTFKLLERMQGGDNPAAASPHLAALRAKRLVMASESTEGSVFNDGLVKSLTGDGHITARQLYQAETVFSNTAKIWLACNNMPRVYDVTPGFWRRLHLIEFDQVFEGARRDNNLKETLFQELPGILAWIVRGAKEWFIHGLNAPESIGNAVSLYREASDPLAGFLEECCYRHADVHTSRSGLYTAYHNYATKEPGRPLTRLKFYELLRGHGFGEARHASARIFKGLCLRNEIHNFEVSSDELRATPAVH